MACVACRAGESTRVTSKGGAMKKRLPLATVHGSSMHGKTKRPPTPPIHHFFGLQGAFTGQLSPQQTADSHDYKGNYTHRSRVMSASSPEEYRPKSQEQTRYWWRQNFFVCLLVNPAVSDTKNNKIPRIQPRDFAVIAHAFLLFRRTKNVRSAQKAVLAYG
jgi:hypothetical protein